MNLTLKPQTLYALAKHIAAKDDIRYYLNAVLIEAAPDAIYCVATDGYKLVAIREEYAEGDERPEVTQQFIVPREACAKPYKDFAAVYTFEGAKVAVRALTKAGTTDTTFALVDAQYPKWRSIMPESVSGEKAQFDPGLCAAVNECYSATVNAKKVVCIPIAHNGNSAGTMIRGDFVGVVMPMRGDKPEAVPAWALPAQPEKVKKAA